jgi:CubicO group peptidase (beta-lactamase class C family)
MSQLFRATAANSAVDQHRHEVMHCWGRNIAIATIVMLSTGLVPCSVAADMSASLPEQIQAEVPQGRELTRADVETWLDGFVPYAIANGEVAGGVIVVVKNGGVLLQKGYGYADVEKKIPVDPQRTLLRAGSVAKVFTWTAMMQLVDQGKIDLDRDINDYLDFEIPAAFGRPITMRHLSTHTSGFEERIKNMAGSGPAQARSLEAYVKGTIPTRIYAPGEVPSYSNYGAALAGYIVQRVSGEDFNDYLDRHVFQPLDMQRSTFRQPLPESLQQDMSRGYVTTAAPPWHFEICNPAPAGGLSTTGADMAQFMISHLLAHSGGDTPLLSPAAARKLHGSISRPIPSLYGMSLGFEEHRDVRRIIGHDGDTEVFHSDMELFLDDGVGLFMSFNSSGKDDAASDILASVFEKFTQRYLPVPPLVETTAATALEHGRQIADAGPYQSSRRAESSFLRLFALLEQQQISVNDDGTIVLPSAIRLNGQPKVWREIAPYVWREAGGVQRLAAHVVDGQVKVLGLDMLAGTQLLQPVPVMRSSAWIVPLVVWAAVALLLTVLHWPVAALVRRHYAAQLSLTPSEMLARRLVRIGALAGLIFLLGWMFVLQIGLGNVSTFGDPLDPWLRLLHLIGLIAVAGAGVAVWNVWLAWRGAQGRWAGLWNVVLAAACIAVVWFAFTYNLITLGLDY